MSVRGAAMSGQFGGGTAARPRQGTVSSRTASAAARAVALVAGITG